ncbi:GNAT family N-acetyltransferase [Chryseobacterium sp. SNU WT5]|uniref:GNAT family N-acetyltransferase n=1 Tax=Chryseobacterium sp. SNU WT5 TaxID=2594269 RepID=UPI001E2B9194|nr:GNAT family N-acetyltransferase [Chryseobacterium sp. SNU WT5]
MEINQLAIDQLVTERLILIPFTTRICENILKNDFSDLAISGLQKGKGWPDDDVMETLPKIIDNLRKVKSPSGFESWIIIKRDTLEIIGDAGFKGFDPAKQNIDLGYGIIKEERKKGYAEEASSSLIQWAFSTDIVAEITANCLIDNISSVHLLQKLNFIKIKIEDKMIYWILSKKRYQQAQ